MSSVSTPPTTGSPASPRPPATPLTVLRPRSGWQVVDLAELWRFRDLLWIFALRDIKIRYKQTMLGALWAVIQPVVQMVVFAVFFGKMLGVEDRIEQIEGRVVPYAVFALSGQVLWNFFNATVTTSANSLLANAEILRKIYVPRIILPFSSAGAPLVDGVIAFVVLLLLMLYYQQPLVLSILLAPVVALGAIIAALGVGILLAALSVSYRDFKYMVPFMVQIWFFVTPVIYPVAILPEDYAWVLYLNPMAGIIETHRAVVLGTTLNVDGLMLSFGVAVLLLVAGLFYFGRVERRFADVV